MTATIAEQLRPLRLAHRDAIAERGRRSTEALVAFETLFRTAARLGQPLDALREHSRDEVERFFARTIPGVDGHVYWDGGREFYMNDGKSRRPARWWWAHAHGRELGPYEDLIATCGDPSCINPEHREVGRGLRRQRFTEQALIGKIQVLALRLGHPPSTVEWEAAGFEPGVSIVVRRLGPWAEALRKAGFPDYVSPWAGSHPVPESRLLEALRFVREHTGAQPTANAMRRLAPVLRAAGLPSSPTTVKRRFGTWLAGVRASEGETP